MKSKGLTLTSAYGVGFTRIMWLMVFGDTSGGVSEVTVHAIFLSDDEYLAPSNICYLLPCLRECFYIYISS